MAIRLNFPFCFFWQVAAKSSRNISNIKSSSIALIVSQHRTRAQDEELKRAGSRLRTQKGKGCDILYDPASQNC